MATEIRLAHDRGHEEQMREILDLAGTDAFDVHWYPRPGDHAHGGIVRAPDHVAQAWAVSEAQRLGALEEPEPDEDFEAAEAQADEIPEVPLDEQPERTGDEQPEGEASPESAPSKRSARKAAAAAKTTAEGDGSNA